MKPDDRRAHHRLHARAAADAPALQELQLLAAPSSPAARPRRSARCGALAGPAARSARARRAAAGAHARCSQVLPARSAAAPPARRASTSSSGVGSGRISSSGAPALHVVALLARTRGSPPPRPWTSRSPPPRARSSPPPAPCRRSSPRATVTAGARVVVPPSRWRATAIPPPTRATRPRVERMSLLRFCMGRLRLSERGRPSGGRRPAPHRGAPGRPPVRVQPDGGFTHSRRGAGSDTLFPCGYRSLTSRRR